MRVYNLVDDNGQYIEPVRLTGKEATVEKKKINYPNFRWSAERQKTLAELYQAGTLVPEIAAHFNTDEDTVYKAINKYNLVQVSHKPVTETAAPEPHSTPPGASVRERKQLLRLRHLGGYANSLQRDAVRLFLDDRCHEAFYALGKQELILNELNGIIAEVIKSEP